jgi:hypothetical protein
MDFGAEAPGAGGSGFDELEPPPVAPDTIGRPPEDELMVPEWMTEPPASLATEWLVVPRPEGKRCVLVSSGGRTVSRGRNGKVMHRFRSGLPGGGGGRGSGGRGAGGGGRGDSEYDTRGSVLDAIFVGDTQTYYVLDVMCWRGCLYYDCPTDFRFFWLHTKMQEEHSSISAGAGGGDQGFAVTPLPYYAASPEAVSGLVANAGQYPFSIDGLLFYNLAAHYTVGPSPLHLVWKDAACSSYLLDTVPAPRQAQLAGGGLLVPGEMDETAAVSTRTPAIFRAMPLCTLEAMNREWNESADDEPGLDAAGQGGEVDVSSVVLVTGDMPPIYCCGRFLPSLAKKITPSFFFILLPLLFDDFDNFDDDFDFGFFKKYFLVSYYLAHIHAPIFSFSLVTPLTVLRFILLSNSFGPPFSRTCLSFFLSSPVPPCPCRPT